MNKKLKVLVACEESQAVTIELRKLGHEAYSCDIEPCSGGHPEWHIQDDVLPILNGGTFVTSDNAPSRTVLKWDMIIAFPPCTHICNNSQRWYVPYGNKPTYLREDGAAFFKNFIDLDCPKVAIENPVGIMSKRFRKPDQIINPFQFGDTECKKTCLWLKGLPELVPTDVIPPERRTNDLWRGKFDGVNYSWNDPKCAKLRSKTFPGIAKAIAIQWAGECI